MARTRNSQGIRKGLPWEWPDGKPGAEPVNGSPSHEGVFIPDPWYDDSLAGKRYAKLSDLVSAIGPERIAGSDLSGDEMLGLLNAHEQCALALREMYARKLSREDSPERRPLFLRKLSREFLSNASVSLSFSDGLLRIRAPHTFARSLNESWYLADMLKACILGYVDENGPICIKPPVHLIVKRIDQGTRQSFRDNDNTENSRLVNEIFRALGYNDSPNNMAYTSLLKIAAEGEWTGTEVVVFSEEHLERHVSEFRQR